MASRRFSSAGIRVHPTLRRPHLEPDDSPPETPVPVVVPRCRVCSTWLITRRSQLRKRCVPCQVVYELAKEAYRLSKQRDLQKHVSAARLLDMGQRPPRVDRDRPEPEAWLD